MIIIYFGANCSLMRARDYFSLSFCRCSKTKIRHKIYVCGVCFMSGFFPEDAWIALYSNSVFFFIYLLGDFIRVFFMVHIICLNILKSLRMNKTLITENRTNWTSWTPTIHEDKNFTSEINKMNWHLFRLQWTETSYSTHTTHYTHCVISA